MSPPAGPLGYGSNMRAPHGGQFGTANWNMGGMGGQAMGGMGPNMGPSSGDGHIGGEWVSMQGMGNSLQGGMDFGNGSGNSGMVMNGNGGGMGGQGGMMGHHIGGGPGPGSSWGQAGGGTGPNVGGGGNKGAGGGPNGRGANNPDFVLVYTFLAGLFDPEVRDSRAKLKSMLPIDRETMLLLMRNLSANLMCQRMWEDQIQLIGAGCPTFVNPSFDDQGMMRAPGQAVQGSRVGRENSNGSSESSRGGPGGDAGNPQPGTLGSNWGDNYIAQDGGNPAGIGGGADGKGFGGRPGNGDATIELIDRFIAAG